MLGDVAMDSKTKEAHRAIRSAIRDGNTAATLVLLREDESHLRMMTPFGSWFHVAASFGNLELVKALVALGLDVNLRGGTLGGAAINVAASNGHIEIVRFLLQSGAELDVSEPERNPLFAAIYGGHIDVVRILIDAGIDHQVRYTGESMKNMDALAFARERGQKAIAPFLANL
jgi:ankyrin repeat protein